jgi:hypothetical protein
MSKTTIADLLAQTLASAGVKRIWGVTGDSLNGFNDSLRRLGKIDWMHVRHEEVAAFAAGVGSPEPLARPKARPTSTTTSGPSPRTRDFRIILEVRLGVRWLLFFP